jgi:hypothetical protein
MNIFRFCDQHMVGLPTNTVETGLRRLAEQIRMQKLVVRLFLCSTGLRNGIISDSSPERQP